MAIPEWLKISPLAGIGDRKVTLTADSNKGTATRECVLTAETSYGKQATCRVLQSGAEEFLRFTSVPESISASEREFHVEGESNAGTLHFILPSAPVAGSISDIEIGGTLYEDPSSSFEVPGNPGADGAYLFRIHYVLDSENDTVEPQNIRLGVSAGSVAVQAAISRMGAELIVEDPDASFDIPASGQIVETEDLTMRIRDDISEIFVSRPLVPDSMDIKVEVSLGYVMTTIPVVPPGGVSAQIDAPSLYKWTSWTPVTAIQTRIMKPLGQVELYRLRVTVPENTENEIRAESCTVIFRTSEASRFATVRVTQEAMVSKLEVSTSVKVVNNSGSYSEGRCYLLLRTSTGESLNICGYLGDRVASGSSYIATYTTSMNLDTAFSAKYLNVNMGYSGRISVSLKIGSRTVSGTLTGGGDLTLSSVLNINPGSTYNVTGTITLN